MPRRGHEFEVTPVSKEISSPASVFLVGLAFDTRELPDLKGLTKSVTVFPFAFLPSENGQRPFLTPLPFRDTGLTGNEMVEINEQVGKALSEQLVDALSVEEENLVFTHLEDGEIPPLIRHEMGYRLLNESEKDNPRMPDCLRNALRNTGMMLLLSVGIDRWLSRVERPSMIEAYRERFEPFFGKLRFKLIGGKLKRDRAIEYPDFYLEFLAKANSTVKQVDEAHDIIALGEGYIFTVGQLVKKGVTIDVITEDPNLYPEFPGYPLKSVIFSLA
ncbi:MAG: hypothetical protein ABIB61_03185 [Candidatus Shapirobacteria bacterium]